MENKTVTSKSLWIFAGIISLGFVVSSFVLGFSVKHFNNNSNAISVKGLAEKPIQADAARWDISFKTNTVSDSIPEAYKDLEVQAKTLKKFFTDHGFKNEELQLGNKSSHSYYETIEWEDGKTKQVFKGYTARQSLTLNTHDIKKIEKAAKDAYLLDEKGLSIDEKPEYLVSNLEEVKMSLIANATKNAYNRANEFAKVGGIKVGAMRSATQGSFYILPEDGSSDDSDYGGTYDKGTINKIARVVVTINYTID